MRLRLKIFSIVFFASFFLLIYRLFYWQVINADKLSAQAKSQYESGITLSAERGNILASDETWLVATTKAWLVYAEPRKIEKDTSKIADELALIFLEEDEDENLLLDEANRLKGLLNKDAAWVPLKHKVDDDTKTSIEALDIEGVGFEKQEARFYPEASSAAHLLGFVGKNSEGEDQGYFGLEGYYDVALSGKPGYLSTEADALGVPILSGQRKEVSAIEGVSLITNIDKSLQLVINEKLKEGIKTYGAKGGTAIVVNPKNGAILAMASEPSFDPKNYWDYSNEDFINPAVSSTFEPGSVFKVVVMASALDASVVEPDMVCDICDGPLRIDKYTIETWNQQYRPGSTMTDVIVHSDNVGMAFTAQKMGIEKMYEYLDKFGFGKKTGIDLQGEAPSKIREKDDWSSVDLATASFGQGIAVTPIQMIKAVSVIANDGISYKPQVVRKIKLDGISDEISPEEEGRIISQKAANEITAMMVEAASSGEAKWTHVKGFGVAGKTGTAQIPIAGHYDQEKTIASFVGFAPYDDPEFAMLVTLREPKSSPWASETAAPLWYSIAKDLFLHFGIQPRN
jgi:cell division protein FtsI/penicillin-binding protein 2